MMGKKVRGLRSTNWQLQNSHGDVKYSIGNIVNSIVITVWCQVGTGNIGGGPLGKYMIVQPLCCKTETNIK